MWKCNFMRVNTKDSRLQQLTKRERYIGLSLIRAAELLIEKLIQIISFVLASYLWNKKLLFLKPESGRTRSAL